MNLHVALFLSDDVLDVSVVPHLRVLILRSGHVALVPRRAFLFIEVQDVDLVMESHALRSEKVIPCRVKHPLRLTGIRCILGRGSEK